VNQGSLINASVSLNKNYLKIIDIQETQDIEFCVRYASSHMWLSCLSLGQEHTLYGTALSYSDEQNVNGYIAITPFTALQSPDDSPVAVNIYVSGENLQFNCYNQLNLPTLRTVLTESFDERGDEPQIGYSCVELNESTGGSENTSTVCFGEQPLSLRSCLKRYVTTNAGTAALGVGPRIGVSFVKKIILPARPAYSVAATSFPTLLEYLPYAYLAVKGGMRKRVRINMPDKDYASHAAINILLNGPETTLTSTGPTNMVAAPRVLEIGSAMYMPRTNGGVEVELPYYSPNLFNFSFASDFVGNLSNGQMALKWWKNFTIEAGTSAASTPLEYSVESAAAEDFTFMRFMGAPYHVVATS